MPPEFIHAHAIIGQNALQLALLNFYGHDVLLVFCIFGRARGHVPTLTRYKCHRRDNPLWHLYQLIVSVLSFVAYRKGVIVPFKSPQPT